MIHRGLRAIGAHAALALILAVPLAGQAIPGPRVEAPLMPVTQRLAHTDAESRAAQSIQTTYTPSYWLEGGVLTAVAFGTAGGAIVYALCDADSGCNNHRGLHAAEGALASGALGFAAGALIGGLIPAKHGHPLAGHPGTGALVGTLVGAFWSFGVVSRFCINGCSSWYVSYDLITTSLSSITGLLLGLGHPHEEQP